jgi:hypothetical protein
MPTPRQYTLQVHAFHDCGKHALVGAETEVGTLWGANPTDLAHRIRRTLGHEPIFADRRLTAKQVPNLTLAYLRRNAS